MVQQLQWLEHRSDCRASDGSGSVRIPASFTRNPIGLKPSRGRIPVGPGSYRGWQRCFGEFCDDEDGS